jgi:hypothetical protein
MEWNVLNYDCGKDRIVAYDVCPGIQNNTILSKQLKSLKHKDSRTSFEEVLNTWAHSRFWARREYEIFVGDAFEDNPNNFDKWDIWEQLAMNWDNFVNYIWENI